MTAPTYEQRKLAKEPVHITFTVHTSNGYLMGSEISNALMQLTMVEFSYYMGFPVLQIAEREYHSTSSIFILSLLYQGQPGHSDCAQILISSVKLTALAY